MSLQSARLPRCDRWKIGVAVDRLFAHMLAAGEQEYGELPTCSPPVSRNTARPTAISAPMMTPSFPFRALFSVSSPPTVRTSFGQRLRRMEVPPLHAARRERRGLVARKRPPVRSSAGSLRLHPARPNSGYMKVLEWRVVQGAGLGSKLIECEFQLCGRVRCTPSCNNNGGFSTFCEEGWGLLSRNQIGKGGSFRLASLFRLSSRVSGDPDGCEGTKLPNRHHALLRCLSTWMPASSAH